MYAAPPSIEAEVFATIPDRFHKSGDNRWIDVQLRGHRLPAFLEGPTFDRGGMLWTVDIPWGRLFRFAPDGTVECALEYDGNPNGLAFHKDGRLFIADARNGIMVFDPTTGNVAPVLTEVLLQPFKGVNDLTFASNGDLYFTDQGQTGLHDRTGRVFRLRADGRVDCLMNNLPSPNGLVLNRSETILYGVHIQLSGGTGPDGLAMDTDDNIAVCHTGLGSVWLFSAVGEPMLRVRAPHGGRHTTNCAFGGPDGTRLFITEGENVLVAQLPVPGRPLFSHQ